MRRIHHSARICATAVVLLCLCACGDTPGSGAGKSGSRRVQPPIDVRLDGSYLRIECLTGHLDSTWRLMFVDKKTQLVFPGTLEQVRTWREADGSGNWFREMYAGDTLRIPLTALGATVDDIPEDLDLIGVSDTIYYLKVNDGAVRYHGYGVWDQR